MLEMWGFLCKNTSNVNFSREKADFRRLEAEKMKLR